MSTARRAETRPGIPTRGVRSSAVVESRARLRGNVAIYPLRLMEAHSTKLQKASRDSSQGYGLDVSQTMAHGLDTPRWLRRTEPEKSTLCPPFRPYLGAQLYNRSELTFASGNIKPSKNGTLPISLGKGVEEEEEEGEEEDEKEGTGKRKDKNGEKTNRSRRLTGLRVPSHSRNNKVPGCNGHTADLSTSGYLTYLRWQLTWLSGNFCPSDDDVLPCVCTVDSGSSNVRAWAGCWLA